MASTKATDMSARDFDRLERWLSGETALTVKGAQSLLDAGVSTDAFRALHGTLLLQALSAMRHGPDAWPRLGLRTRRA